MVTSIHFSNFKALSNFTIHLKDFNVLTGPNNNGKSTILDGIRVLHAAYRSASRYNPKVISSPYGKDFYGYEIPLASIPIIIHNIQTDFNTNEPSIVTFKFSQGQSLSLYFHPDHPIYLFFETPRRIPKTSKSFQEEFPLNISIIPTLGPFEIEEELRDSDYVRRWYGSRRSPRMFRSYWFHNYGDFSQFKKLVEDTWKGMSILRPERKEQFSKELVMFCEENRITREICWAGFGFQIWLQLLTHIVNAKNADVIIVDEPEIYLHPDLQHKILDLLRNTKAKIVLATHSVEIINSVEPNEVLLIDKRSKVAKRISDLEGLQGVSNILGSGQNIQLTRLARGKKILFVEGEDVKLLGKLSKVAKMPELFSSGEITVIPIEGFSQNDKIIHTNWAFSKILGEELQIAVLLDKDYRTDEEILEVKTKLSSEVGLVHIWTKKEMENYFLIPNAIRKAIDQRVQERIATGTINASTQINVESVLIEMCEQLKTETLSKIIASRAKIDQKLGLDISTVIASVTIEFEKKWENLSFKLSVVPGRIYMGKLNEYLQREFKISITFTQIANNILFEELDNGVLDFFIKLNEMRVK